MIHLHVCSSRVNLCNLSPRIHTVKLNNLLSDLMHRVTVNAHRCLCLILHLRKLFQPLALVRKSFELRLHL